jgi:hypothetical protein
MKEEVRASGCPIEVIDLYAHPGWTSQMFLSNESEWRPAIEGADAPVIVYLTIGFNDLFKGGGDARTLEKAGRDATELIRRLALHVVPGGGEVIHIGYDDIWSLPDQDVTYMGETQRLSRIPSGPLVSLYSLLPNSMPHYRFVDVRGWLADTLWTDDGIHLADRSYAKQAPLLWDRVFSPALGCGGESAKQPANERTSRAIDSRQRLWKWL